MVRGVVYRLAPAATSFLALLWVPPAHSSPGGSPEKTVVLESRPVSPPPSQVYSPDETQHPAGEWEEFFTAHRRTVTREDFFRCLRALVPEKSMPPGFVVDRGNYAEIAHPSGKIYRLLFSPSRILIRNPGRYWRHPAEVRAANPSLPLSGARIAIDPGHIGGDWAQREGRLFYGSCGTRIAEGDMNLKVARLLKTMLERDGAKVWLTRSDSDPLNGSDPSLFRERAERELRLEGRPVNEATVQSESDRLLLQVAEIEARARLINERIRPDLVVCLHFNAEPWGTRSSPRFSTRNHLHVLVGGSYLHDELAKSENRLDLVRRAAEGTHMVELPLARAVAARLAQETGLPPFSYGVNSRVAAPDPASPFVWKRNLLATRTFHCPVIYPEPFVMNNRDFVAAVAGSPAGGWARAVSKSDIFAQYARGVHGGILDYWVSRSPTSGHLQRVESTHHGGKSIYSPRWLEE